MNWYTARYLCKRCKGCASFERGESDCLCENERDAEDATYPETF